MPDGSDSMEDWLKQWQQSQQGHSRDTILDSLGKADSGSRKRKSKPKSGHIDEEHMEL